MTDRLILSVAAAQYELETVATLMSSIGSLAQADAYHQVKRVEYNGPGWAETQVCTCGEWVQPEQSWDAHVVAMAGAYE